MGSKPPPLPPPPAPQAPVPQGVVPQPPIPIPPPLPAPPPHLPPHPAPPALTPRGDPPSKQKSVCSGMGAPGKPPAGTPKSQSKQSAPRAPVLPAAAPAPAPQQAPPPQPPPPPPIMQPRATPEPAIPASAPDSPQVLASPAAVGGIAVAPRDVKSPMIARKSAPNTPGGTPAVSAKSARHVEFVPPTEYVDMSRIAIRSMQFVFVCEMFFHVCGVAYAMLYIEMFYRYRRTFTEHTSKASMVAPAALGLAALLTFRTIHGVFAINFTTPSNTARASGRLLTLLAAHILYGAVMMLAASTFKSVISSDELQDLIRRNIAHLIRYATSDRGYMEMLNEFQTQYEAAPRSELENEMALLQESSARENEVKSAIHRSGKDPSKAEINRIQQHFQCCGMKSDALLQNGSYTEADHPWNMWFDSYSLDETYPSVIRELYSLPWSCCNLTFGIKCEHIGVSRYLRKFATPTDFNDVETVLLVHELDWNPTSFEHYLERNELAISTLYDADCAEEVKRGVDEKANLISSLIFKAGIVMLSCSIPLMAAVAHLQCIMKSRGQAAQAQVASSSRREVGAGDMNRVRVRGISSRSEGE